jgi:hypothetical protein
MLAPVMNARLPFLSARLVVATPLLALLQTACLDVSLDGATIHCTSSADCPEKQVCVTSIETCAPAGKDLKKPAIVSGSVSLDDDVYAPGRTVKLSFTVDSDLAVDPVVVFATDARPAFGVVERDGRTWSLQAQLTGSEGEGALSIVATLVSSDGGVTEDAAVATLTIDATPPTTTSLGILGQRTLRPGATGVVELTASEALQAATLRLVDADTVVGALEDTGELEAPLYRFRYTASGSEPASTELEVVLVDEAGNTAPPARVPGFLFDAAAPTLSLATVTPVAVKRDRRLELVVSSSEPLSSLAAQLRSGADTLPLTATVSDAGGAVLVRDVTGDDPEGAWDLEVTSFADASGNPGAPTTFPAAVVVDQTAPGLASSSTVPPAPAAGVLRLPLDATLQLDFLLDEPAASPPVVRLDGVPLSDGACTDLGDATAFTCALVTSASFGEGVHQLSADVLDEAGNLAVLSLAAVLFDFSAPVVAGSAALRSPGLQRSDPALTSTCDTDVLLLSRTEPDSGAPTAAVITLFADELLDDAPGAATLLVTTPDGAVLEVSASRIQLAVAEFIVDASLLPTEGCYPLAVRWSDQQGTSAVRDLEGRAIYVDETAPLVSADPAALVYHRAPNGTREAPAPSFFVEGKVGAITRALPGKLRVAVARDDSGDPAHDVGDAVVDADGSFVAAVRGGDPGVVFVVPVSPAGARGVPVVARTVEYTVALNGKQAGNTFTNPNRFDERKVFSPGSALVPDAGAVERSASTGVATSGGDVLVTGAGASYLNVPRSGGVIRGVEGMAWDPVRGLVVATLESGTAEWRGAGFARASILDTEGDGNPTTDLSGTSMITNVAYDTTRGQVMAAAGGTYHYTGTSWRRVPDLDTEPSVFSMAMASSPELGLTVGFGGCHDGLPCFTPGEDSASTWIWDGSGWTEIPVDVEGVTTPARRSGHWLAWDPGRGVFVLVGGFFNFPQPGQCAALGGVDGTNSCVFVDTWELDPLTRVWTKIDISSFTPPFGQVNFVAGFDDDLAAVVAVVNGGRTFAYDGRWRELAMPGDSQPPTNFVSQPVFDPTSRLLLAATDFPEPAVHGFDGTRWRKLRANSDPAQTVLLGHAMAFDDVRKTIVMFGGKAGTPNAELLNHDGFKFTTTSPGTKPPARFSMGFAWDTFRHVGVLFSGSNNASGAFSDVWEWNGTTWTQRCEGSPAGDVCGALPPSRTELSLAFHASRREILLFGGSGLGGSLNDTWVYNGTTWSQCVVGGAGCNLVVGPDGAPPAGRGPQLAYDPTRDRTVMFVNDGLVNQTWEWTGRSWVKRLSSTPGDPETPPTSLDTAMVFDPSRGAVIETVASTDFNEMQTWLWDGATGRWRKLDVVDPEGDGSPPPRFFHAAAADPARGVLVVDGAGAPAADAWRLTPAARPAHVFIAPFALANAPGGAVVTDVRVSWTAGGEGTLSGTSVNGALLFAWIADGFQSVAAGPGTSSAPREIDFSAAESGLGVDEMRSMFIGAEQRIAFAVASVGVDGVAQAKVATDAVDATVRYVLP